MKGSAKFSVEAFAVLNGAEDAIQYTISIRVRGKVVQTLTVTERSTNDVGPAIASFLVNNLGEQLDRQRAFHLVDEEHPFQEELPF